MTIKDALRAYLQHLQTLGRSRYTIKNARSALRSLLAFLEEQHLTNVEELQADVLEDYQQDLAFQVTAKGNLLALRTQGQKMMTLKSFTKFLRDKDYLLHDPGSRLTLPRKPKRLPKVILSTRDVKKLSEAPDTHTNRGYRNRIIIEILYDTAIRRSELAGIKINDLDLNAGFIRIQGS